MTLNEQLYDALRRYRRFLLVLLGAYIALAAFLTFIYSYLSEFDAGEEGAMSYLSELESADTGATVFFLFMLVAGIGGYLALRVSVRVYHRAAARVEEGGPEALSRAEWDTLWTQLSQRPLRAALAGSLMTFSASLLAAFLGGHLQNGFQLGLWAGLIVFLTNYNVEINRGAALRDVVGARSHGHWAGRKFSLQVKIIVLGLLLTFMPTLLMGTIGLSQGGDLLLKTRETEFLDRSRTLAAAAEELLGTGHEMRSVTGTLYALGLVYGVDVVFYDLYDQRYIMGAMDEDELRQAIDKQNGWIFIGSEEEGTQGRFFFQQLLTGDKMVGFVVSEEKYAPEFLFGRSSQTVLVAVISFAFAGVIGFFIARTLSSPITRMVNQVRGIAEGDLSEDISLATDDEMEDLATGIQDMTNNLRDMVGGVKSAASAVRSAVERIKQSTDAITEGAENQSVAIEETTSSLTMMDGSIQSISHSLQDLSQAVGEGSSSVLEMSASTGEVAESADHLSTAVESVTTAIEQMARSIIAIAENVENLRKTAEQSSASMVEMDSTIQEVGRVARDTADLAKTAADDAEHGAKAVTDTTQGITAIRDSFENAETVIENLSERAERIDEIVAVITHVAEETTLLALNAAIIAAQAGERGRGFGVVAGEIKALAERTGKSTKEIADVIRSVQNEAKGARQAMRDGKSKVEDGVKLAGEAGQSLEKILASVQDASQMVAAIARATDELSRGSEGVVKGIETTTGMVQAINSSTQEQSRGSEHISREADKMRQIADLVKRTTKEQAEGGRRTTQSIEAIRKMADDIAHAQQEQASSSKQVLGSTDQIRAVSQENKEIVRAMENALRGLNTEVEVLAAAIGRFRFEDNGGPPEAGAGEAPIAPDAAAIDATDADVT